MDQTNDSPETISPLRRKDRPVVALVLGARPISGLVTVSPVGALNVFPSSYSVHGGDSHHPFAPQLASRLASSHSKPP